MAYLNFSDVQGGIYGEAPRAAPRANTGFSALEWSVVAIAQKDRLSSLNQPGRIASALGVVFGDRPNPRLADSRLEALRRMSVLAWHRGYAVPASEIRAFKDAGFNTDQYETLLASISRGRASLNQRVAA